MTLNHPPSSGGVLNDVSHSLHSHSVAHNTDPSHRDVYQTPFSFKIGFSIFVQYMPLIFHMIRPLFGNGWLFPCQKLSEFLEDILIWLNPHEIVKMDMPFLYQAQKK